MLLSKSQAKWTTITLTTDHHYHLQASILVRRPLIGLWGLASVEVLGENADSCGGGWQSCGHCGSKHNHSPIRLHFLLCLDPNLLVVNQYSVQTTDSLKAIKKNIFLIDENVFIHTYACVCVYT